MENTKLISICLGSGSEIVSDAIYTVPIVFCSIGGLATTQPITSLVMKHLAYYIVLGMDWLKPTNTVLD